MISNSSRYLLLLIAALLLAACGTKQVVVEGNFPTPVMTPVALTLGVWFDEEFQTHEFFDEAAGRSGSKWLVKTGDAQVQMWNILLGGMFTHVVPMRDKPAPDVMNPVVDAVLIPHIDELQYTIPAYTNVKVYELWLRYRYELVTTSGEPIADWTMTAYGKTPTAFLQSDEAAVNLAAVVALRDAGANFAANFQKVPAVKEWMALRGKRAQEPKP